MKLTAFHRAHSLRAEDVLKQHQRLFLLEKQFEHVAEGNHWVRTPSLASNNRPDPAELGLMVGESDFTCL